MSGSSSVKTETEDFLPVAVVYGNNSLCEVLFKLLQKEKLRVMALPHPQDVLSILVRPNYLFYFVPSVKSLAVLENQLVEAAQSAARAKTRVVLVFPSRALAFEKDITDIFRKNEARFMIVELSGRFEEKGVQEDLSKKLIELSFSHRFGQRQVLLGTQNESEVGERREFEDVGAKVKTPYEVLKGLTSAVRKQKIRGTARNWGLSPGVAVFLIIVVALLLVVLGPIFWVSLGTALAVRDLVEAKNMLVAGKFSEAETSIGAARGKLVGLRELGAMGYRYSGNSEVAGSYYRLVDLLYRLNETLDQVGQLGPQVVKLPQAVMDPATSEDESKIVDNLKLSLPLVDQQLGLLQAQMELTFNDSQLTWMKFFGFPVDKLSSYQEAVSQIRLEIARVEQIVGVLPAIVGQDGTEKVYLVAFQNSSELRPTGGFVGSFALVRFKSGKLLEYKVFDVYSADNQLRGQVAPPDEILHYLGQTAWYLRDANFAPDFPLTAKRMEWFLEREVGQRVDGVVAVDVGAVEKLLGAVGPVKLPDFNDIVGAEDFYHKTEYQAEIEFFPGSTKKRDYLGAVAQAILDQATSGAGGHWVGLGEAVKNSFLEKDALVYFNDPEVQKVFSDGGYVGSIRQGYCATYRPNCLMVVESNFGANKANFFVQRNFAITAMIDKGGGVQMTVKMDFENDSPTDTWPGGVYKDYLRFLVPTGSKLLQFDLGDGRVATVSSTLTADVIAAVPTDKFLVYHSNEKMLLGESLVDSGMDSFGALSEIPVGSKREVTFSYSPPYRMSFNQNVSELRLGLLKQPGIGSPAMQLEVDFPGFLQPSSISDNLTGVNTDISHGAAGVLVFPQKLIYNDSITTDRFLTVKFKK